MQLRKVFQGEIPENKIMSGYSDSQTDTYSCEYANNNFSVNYIDNELVPTNEYLNGKRIYAYRFQFSQALTKSTEYTFDLPFADEIDFAWIDLSNSFMDNHLGTTNYNVWCLGTTSGYGFRLGIPAKNKISITPDDTWGVNWTYTIMVKCTLK